MIRMNPFDLQVNGYAGTDFNSDNLTAEALHHACECLVEDGCDNILATFITDEIPTLERRIGKLVEGDQTVRLCQHLFGRHPIGALGGVTRRGVGVGRVGHDGRCEHRYRQADQTRQSAHQAHPA
jgi:hypothetical protein